MSPNFTSPMPHAYANGGTGDPADLVSVDGKNLASSLNNYPAEPAMPSPGHQALNSNLLGDQPPKPLPKIGETRCYWTLLSAGLDFIYLDPVLQSHLEEQSGMLVGKSLLDFVHPDECASAKHDLGSVLESKTLHGSVTRVRYCRLSRIRYDLGHRTAQSPWIDADKIALDDNYMAVDIVINWAADGLVLCFIHAVTDLTPNDNDEKHKSQWSNWCGTPYMAMQQIELLYQRLLVCIPQTNSPSRVFQILNNADQKSLLMTWPPDQGQGRDYAKLVDAVNIRTGESGEDDAKTSCTRRYKAMQSMPFGEVECIIIPHGTIVFACHKLNQPYFDQASNGYAAPSYPQSAPPYSGSGYHPQQTQYPQQWTEGSDDVRPAHYPAPAHWGTQPYMDPGSAFPRAASPEFYSTSAGGAGDSNASEIPPPRRRVSPSLSGSTRESNNASVRSAGNRPIGIQKCTSCKTTSSPEWRKGPSGKKELCNACGLRFARSRAKKDGTTLSAAHRKRKEKNISVKTNRCPAPSPINGGSQSGSRRAFDDSQGSQGSGSGSQGDYATHMEGVSRSPSPDGASANFVHYSHPSGAHHRNSQPQALHNDTRSNPYSNSTNSFYSASSPLSNSNVHQSHGNLARSNSQSQMSAIRGTDPSYESPLASTTSVPASFERGGGERVSKLSPAQPVSESRMASAHSMLMLQH